MTHIDLDSETIPEGTPDDDINIGTQCINENCKHCTDDSECAITNPDIEDGVCYDFVDIEWESEE